MHLCLINVFPIIKFYFTGCYVFLITLYFCLSFWHCLFIGFLPAHVEGSVRGNYGLMDQVAALHWVQENIAEFGGNADNVTVIGHGFGAACVHLLMLSPMAKGRLFLRCFASFQCAFTVREWVMRVMTRDGQVITGHISNGSLQHTLKRLNYQFALICNHTGTSKETHI